MKLKVYGIAVLFILLASCKKEYTCNCTTLDPQQGFVKNPETYKVKEKNEDDALVNCAKQYSDSGKATNGINCTVN